MAGFFEITRHIGVVKKYSNGWSKEINMVSWYEKPPKVDIRDWDPNHERMSRGVSLTPEEFVEAVSLVNKNMPELFKKGGEEDDR